MSSQEYYNQVIALLEEKGFTQVPPYEDVIHNWRYSYTVEETVQYYLVEWDVD